ncbi:MAG: 3-dehydroquinate synthase [Prevotella sp.]|nr:3-dehydroquinate synthase [Prevotella sp.]
MEEQKVIISENLEPALSEAVRECKADKLFVLTDETTQRLCWPLASGFDCMKGANMITIGAGDEHKTLLSLTHVWEELQRLGATRHSLLVNLGGGMVTDLGGFAASTFKRGLSLVNIPTTLLAMVDASVGGKTGINFGGLKNELGVFRNASSVILDTTFLRTLDRENILSGYAEMLKHGLIAESGERRAEGRMLAELLTFNVEQPDLAQLGRMVADSVKVKQRIVLEDPTEQGIRKALNLGHTIGHAFESLALQASERKTQNAKLKPVLHGYAVAWGLVCELYLSVAKTGFPVDTMRQVVRFILDHYGRMAITCDDYPTLLELMTHDKKNTAGRINFTLLGGVGDIRINQTATKEEIVEALDFYREG